MKLKYLFLLLFFTQNSLSLFDKLKISVLRSYYESKLFRAAFDGDIPKIIKIINMGIDFNTRNPQGLTPFIYAINNGQMETVQLFIDLMEEDFSKKNLQIHCTIGLLWAIKNNQLEIAELLLNKGAQVKDENYGSPITLAITSNLESKKEFIKLLMNYEADINTIEKGGSTAIIEACSKGNIEIVKFLIKNGAKINQKDKNGKTALFYATILGYKKIVEHLIKSGANINYIDKTGKTPLLYAAEIGQKEIFDLLIINKAKINSKRDKKEIKLIRDMLKS